MESFNGIGTTIYGSAKKQELIGDERIKFEKLGYIPYSYQVIKWVIFLFFPVIPLGTYRILKPKDDSLSSEFPNYTDSWSTDWPKYYMVRVEWDWKQVTRHYLIAYGWIILIIILILYKFLITR